MAIILDSDHSSFVKRRKMERGSTRSILWSVLLHLGLITAVYSSMPFMTRKTPAPATPVNTIEYIELDVADEVVPAPEVLVTNAKASPDEKAEDKPILTEAVENVPQSAQVEVKKPEDKHDTSTIFSSPRTVFNTPTQAVLRAQAELEHNNPLLGSGERIKSTPPPSVYHTEKQVNSSAPSLITSRHKRRKEGAYTGGLYSMSPLSDPLGAGVGVIAYAANASNCAHEEARTGVNRCRMRERWVDQKVAEFLKEQNKK